MNIAKNWLNSDEEKALKIPTKMKYMMQYQKTESGDLPQLGLSLLLLDFSWEPCG
jgi:hypothetical protein